MKAISKGWLGAIPSSELPAGPHRRGNGQEQCDVSRLSKVKSRRLCVSPSSLVSAKPCVGSGCVAQGRRALHMLLLFQQGPLGWKELSSLAKSSWHPLPHPRPAPAAAFLESNNPLLVFADASHQTRTQRVFSGSPENLEDIEQVLGDSQARRFVVPHPHPASQEGPHPVSSQQDPYTWGTGPSCPCVGITLAGREGHSASPGVLVSPSLQRTPKAHSCFSVPEASSLLLNCLLLQCSHLDILP